ncbi:MAG: hypothetical protein WCF67_05220 [Chitinophagaceae bacterium]
MEFLFHSVIEQEGHALYYNVYRVDDTHFFAECHHFNRHRVCEGDFELQKEGEEWKSATEKFAPVALLIGEEIDRMEGADKPA